MPLAVYTAMETDLNAAVTLAVILLVLSATVLVGLRLAPWGVTIGGTRARARGH